MAVDSTRGFAAAGTGLYGGPITLTSYVWEAAGNALPAGIYNTVPTVTTESASSPSQTGATLNGTITATGGANPTTRGFAWGTLSTLSGGDTATTTESGSFSTGAFTNSSLTLVCNTTYYARAYATNSAGTSLGSISASFTTSACSSQNNNTPTTSTVSTPGAISVVTTGTYRPDPFLNSITTATPKASSPAAPPATPSTGGGQAAPTKNLSLHATGQNVVLLQKFLNQNGAKLPPTGYFGTLTYQALVKYQRAHKLPATGYYGPMTRAVMTRR